MRFALSTVEMTGNLLSSLRSHLNDFFRSDTARKEMIELDHLVITITQITLTLLELKKAVEPFTVTTFLAPWDTPLLRIAWMKRDTSVATIIGRLNSHKSSLSLISTIIQS
jgi:hypothetical protein